MNEHIIFLIIAFMLAAFLVLWLLYFIAEQFHKAACDKGYTQSRYFWIPFFFGIVGYMP